MGPIGNRFDGFEPVESFFDQVDQLFVLLVSAECDFAGSFKQASARDDGMSRRTDDLPQVIELASQFRRQR